MLPLRNPQLAAALTLLVILTWIGWTFRRSNTVTVKPLITQPSHQEPSLPRLITAGTVLAESELLTNLCHFGLCDISPGASITYGRIKIDVLESSSFKPPLLQNISISFPHLRPLDLIATSRGPDTWSQKTAVEAVSKPKPADASNIIFGVATNIHRLEESLGQFSHWASNNGVCIIALVPSTSLSESIDITFQKSQSLNLNLTILTSDMSFDDRYFHLTSLMHNHSTTSTAWLSFIDDDTFFPSMTTLQTLLSKYPSPKSQPYYIGALSEDFHQLFKWGMMAYGGGGIFLSVALLAQLLPHLPSCALLPYTGDARIAQCVYTHTTTKLTPETLLYQIDLWGDASGFYEALRPQPISVHHWKSWHKFDMVNISKVSAVCGDACVFQKYRFADDWQLTNGFSIVKYSDGYQRNDTDLRMEKTWWDSQGGTLDMFSHSVAPLRAKDENKMQFLLEGCVTEEDGTVRQFYVRRSIKDGRSMVQIVEVTWKRSGKSAV